MTLGRLITTGLTIGTVVLTYSAFESGILTALAKNTPKNNYFQGVLEEKGLDYVINSIVKGTSAWLTPQGPDQEKLADFKRRIEEEISLRKKIQVLTRSLGVESLEEIREYTENNDLFVYTSGRIRVTDNSPENNKMIIEYIVGYRPGGKEVDENTLAKIHDLVIGNDHEIAFVQFGKPGELNPVAMVYNKKRLELPYKYFLDPFTFCLISKKKSK